MAYSRPTLFTNENKFDSIITKYLTLYNKEFNTEINISTIKGFVAQESGFIPSAVRYEENIKQYSLGLCQILPSTAKMFGYNKETENLADADTSLKYGMKYFYSQFKQYRTYSNAYASYNAGSVKRTDTGKYINQFYVDMASLYAKFYYYRDIIGDNEIATLTKIQINERKKGTTTPTTGVISLLNIAEPQGRINLLLLVGSMALIGYLICRSTRGGKNV